LYAYFKIKIKKPDNLNAILSTIDIVSKEEEAGRHQCRTHSPQSLLEADQIMVVAMQVTLTPQYHIPQCICHQLLTKLYKSTLI